MTADPGLTAATGRVMALLGCYPDESGQCSAMHAHDIGPAAAEALARVAREDYPDVEAITRTAKAEGVVMVSRRIGEEIRDWGIGLIEGSDEGEQEIAAQRERMTKARSESTDQEVER